VRSLALVARREFAAYWTSPIAYVTVALFAALAGIYFFAGLYDFVTRASRSGGQGVDVNQELIRPYLQGTSVLILFLLPLVSMRLVAEERRQGTLEILLTTPARDAALLLGKYAGSLGLFAALLAVPLLHVLLLFLFGKPEPGPVLTGFAGLFLSGASYLALGIFFSALTQNQVVAAVAAFSLSLILWLVYQIGTMTSGALGQILAAVSFAGHFDSFARGVLDSADLLYFLSIIAAGLYGATQAVTAQRWKP
jgi:ABC-2 type transport system permease protein